MIKLMSNNIALDVKMILAWSQIIFLNHVDKSEKCKKITLTFVKLKNLIFDKKCLTLTGFMYIFRSPGRHGFEVWKIEKMKRLKPVFLMIFWNIDPLRTSKCVKNTEKVLQICRNSVKNSVFYYNSHFHQGRNA